MKFSAKIKLQTMHNITMKRGKIMKKRLSALLFAAVLLTGCADNAPVNEPQQSQTSHTTEAASDTAEATSSTSQTTTQSSATTRVTTASKPVETKPAALDAEELFGKSPLNVDIMKSSFGTSNPIIGIDGNIVTTYPQEYTTYYSLGMMLTELTQEFKDALKSNHYSYGTNGNWYSAESFGDYTIEYDIGRISTDAITVDEYTVSLKGNKIYRRNAFIRQTESGKYEFIIDPRYMYDIPLLDDNYAFMKFEVNGTEFYADTLSVMGCKLNMIGDEFDTYGLKINEDYVYASVTFKDLDIIFNSESGYSNAADVIKIEVLTEDTDSVINGGYYENVEMRSLDDTAGKLIDEFYTNISRTSLIDLDFDGTPELIHSYYPPYASMGEYMINDIYTLDGGEAKLVDTIHFDFLYEAEYGGKHGWIVPYQEIVYNEEGYVDNYFEDGVMFFALENGELYKHEFGYSSSEKKEDGSWEHTDTINGAPVTLIAAEPNVNEFDGRMIAQYLYNGKQYGGYWDVLRAEYEPYLSDNNYKLYYGDHNYSHGLENSYILKTLTTADIVRFYNEPKELQYREEAAHYFEGGKAKPVIYLYPEETTEISVKVDFPYGGEFSCTYPDYRDGWSVTAEPDGTLFDEDGNEYYCLYWEGEGGPSYDMSEGFCVKGRDTAEFLREKLLHMGLSPREANEFIIYWLPLMEDNNYNIISFHTDAYDLTAPLTVSPAPDSVIRVFMTWYASDEPRDIEAQELPAFKREGFTVVEWGGSQYGK